MAPAARATQTQRPRLLQAVLDAWAQPDVRAKLAFVFAMLVIFRFVAHIPIPGVAPERLRQAFEGDTSTGAFLSTLNIFSGGALRRLSVAALGVYPYITASIIMQIVTPLFPQLQALPREGEAGRNRLQLYTHWLGGPAASVSGAHPPFVPPPGGGGDPP